MNIDAGALASGLRTVLPATKAGHLPVLKGVLLETTGDRLHLTATDLDMTITTEVEAGGASLTAVVPGALLAAWAEGVGEKLTPLSLGAGSWFVVVFPGVAVPTAAVFQAAELTRNSPPTTMRGFLETGGRNDCEGVVRARFPAVGEALDWLGRHAPARLTGTGSCVFANFARVEDAERFPARVPDEWRAFVARRLDESPLRKELEKF